MKIVNEGNGLWGIERDGERVVTGESYQVVSNICEMSVYGLPDESDEVRDSVFDGMREQRKILSRMHGSERDES